MQPWPPRLRIPESSGPADWQQYQQHRDSHPGYSVPMHRQPSTAYHYVSPTEYGLGRQPAFSPSRFDAATGSTYTSHNGSPAYSFSASSPIAQPPTYLNPSITGSPSVWVPQPLPSSPTALSPRQVPLNVHASSFDPSSRPPAVYHGPRKPLGHANTLSLVPPRSRSSAGSPISPGPRSAGSKSSATASRIGLPVLDREDKKAKKRKIVVRMPNERQTDLTSPPPPFYRSPLDRDEGWRVMSLLTNGDELEDDEIVSRSRHFEEERMQGLPDSIDIYLPGQLSWQDVQDWLEEEVRETLQGKKEPRNEPDHCRAPENPAPSPCASAENETYNGHTRSLSLFDGLSSLPSRLQQTFGSVVHARHAPSRSMETPPTAPSATSFSRMPYNVPLPASPSTGLSHGFFPTGASKSASGTVLLRSHPEIEPQHHITNSADDDRARLSHSTRSSPDALAIALHPERRSPVSHGKIDRHTQIGEEQSVRRQTEVHSVADSTVRSAFSRVNSQQGDIFSHVSPDDIDMTSSSPSTSELLERRQPAFQFPRLTPPRLLPSRSSDLIGLGLVSTPGVTSLDLYSPSSSPPRTRLSALNVQAPEFVFRPSSSALLYESEHTFGPFGGTPGGLVVDSSVTGSDSSSPRSASSPAPSTTFHATNPDSDSPAEQNGISNLADATFNFRPPLDAPALPSLKDGMRSPGSPKRRRRPLPPLPLTAIAHPSPPEPSLATKRQRIEPPTDSSAERTRESEQKIDLRQSHDGGGRTALEPRFSPLCPDQQHNSTVGHLSEHRLEDAVLNHRTSSMDIDLPSASRIVSKAQTTIDSAQDEDGEADETSLFEIQDDSPLSILERLMSEHFGNLHEDLALLIEQKEVDERQSQARLADMIVARVETKLQELSTTDEKKEPSLAAFADLLEPIRRRIEAGQAERPQDLFVSAEQGLDITARTEAVDLDGVTASSQLDRPLLETVERLANTSTPLAHAQTPDSSLEAEDLVSRLSAILQVPLSNLATKQDFEELTHKLLALSTVSHTNSSLAVQLSALLRRLGPVDDLQPLPECHVDASSSQARDATDLQLRCLALRQKTRQSSAEGHEGPEGVDIPSEATTLRAQLQLAQEESVERDLEGRETRELLEAEREKVVMARAEVMMLQQRVAEKEQRLRQLTGGHQEVEVDEQRATTSVDCLSRAQAQAQIGILVSCNATLAAQLAESEARQAVTRAEVDQYQDRMAALEVALERTKLCVEHEVEDTTARVLALVHECDQLTRLNEELQDEREELRDFLDAVVGLQLASEEAHDVVVHLGVSPAPQLDGKTLVVDEDGWWSARMLVQA